MKPLSDHDDAPTVALVGAEIASTSGLRAVFAEHGERPLFIEDSSSALGWIAENRPKLVILAGDIAPEVSLALLERIRASHDGADVIVVAGRPSTDWAVRFVRAGACDYAAGPLDADRLGQLLAGFNAQARRGSPPEQRFFLPTCPPGVPIAGRSEGIARVLEMTRIVAQSRCNPILILGETGTGKELIARAVHAWRCGGAETFVAVNCATLSPTLLESELFGHVRGAFTGADREKTGLLEAAGSGSILLDEISEMPAELQAKLLRFLQEKAFRRVGGTKDIPCRATIIASSNWALFEESMAGRFRRDLYYRLAVFPVRVPPLRDPQRRADIPLLAEYFIFDRGDDRSRPLSKQARQELLGHSWPGNVRELRNVIERALLLETADEITAASLVIERADETDSGAAPAGGGLVDFSLEAAERELIRRALQESNWQRTRAAALLGITRATLYAKIKRYSLQPSA
ncbi:MAG TPA: sigma-54 dependent transcriptional regulator [Phycisphaerae bacterium]|nr:sigma-54 dependent transcriptional regulator [Phycisphaerae bacterium]